MRKLTSKLLGLFLPDVSAGACVIDHGCCCNSAHTKTVNCVGVCVTLKGCRTTLPSGPC
jgi:hypothetical protein